MRITLHNVKKYTVQIVERHTNVRNQGVYKLFSSSNISSSYKTELALQKNNHISKAYKIAIKTNNKTFTRVIRFKTQIAF